MSDEEEYGYDDEDEDDDYQFQSNFYFYVLIFYQDDFLDDKKKKKVKKQLIFKKCPFKVFCDFVVILQFTCIFKKSGKSRFLWKTLGFLLDIN